MAITKHSKTTQGTQVWSGLSSDTKPTPATNDVYISSLFYETDTGNKLEYRGALAGWVITSGPSAIVETSVSSVNAYGAYPANLGDSFVGIIGVNDNDIIYTSPDVTYSNNVMIECTAGSVDVEVTADGTNYRLATLRTVTVAGVVVVDDIDLVTTEHGILNELDVGKFSNFRLLQKGATASNARGRYGVS